MRRKSLGQEQQPIVSLDACEGMACPFGEAGYRRVGQRTVNQSATGEGKLEPIKTAEVGGGGVLLVAARSWMRAHLSLLVPTLGVLSLGMREGESQEVPGLGREGIARESLGAKDSRSWRSHCKEPAEDRGSTGWLGGGTSGGRAFFSNRGGDDS